MASGSTYDIEKLARAKESLSFFLGRKEKGATITLQGEDIDVAIENQRTVISRAKENLEQERQELVAKKQDLDDEVRTLKSNGQENLATEPSKEAKELADKIRAIDEAIAGCQ